MAFYNSVLGMMQGIPFLAKQARPIGYRTMPKLHAEAVPQELRYILHTQHGAIWSPPISGVRDGLLMTQVVNFSQEFDIVNIICCDLIRYQLVKPIGLRFPIHMDREAAAFGFAIPQYQVPCESRNN